MRTIPFSSPTDPISASTLLGWLPAMGILTPATRHPWRRNLVMIAAHVIWGLAAGEGVQKLTENRTKGS